MIKVPFEIMDAELDKLYQANWQETDLTKIDAQVKFIAEFIKACGWDEESYIREMMGFNKAN